jgi:signal transduction histidine kinase
VSTEFAPPERASQDELQATIQQVANHPLVAAMFSAVDVIPLLLNRQRQVIAFNPEALRRLGVADTKALLGMRPGEVFQCMTRDRGPSGCGTSKDCQVCGIVNAILESQKTGKTTEREGLLQIEKDGREGTLELLVRAAPVTIRESSFTFVYLRDISDLKRRQVLERIFLHDLRNTIAGLLGWTSHLHDELGPQGGEVLERILIVADRLNREVEDQYALLQAESGNFRPLIGAVQPAEIFSKLKTLIERALYTEDKTLTIREPVPDVTLRSDPSLIIRILSNMLKNAFEATPRGGRVELWCQVEDRECTFLVQNSGEIPDEVTAQIFRRSFSTKAETGRGLGTYSMKLFGERYLQGQVSFSSTPEQGTIFRLMIPRELKD